MYIIEFGKYEGRDITEAPTEWLLWVSTLHSLRRGHHDFVVEALLEIQRRLNDDFDGTVTALKVTTKLKNMRPAVTIEQLRKRTVRQ